jgi:hypothetical protein
MDYLDEEGVCFFAYNNSQIDYIKLVLLAADYVKTHLKKPVCLITDEGGEAYLNCGELSKELIDKNIDYVVVTDDKFRKNIRGHFDSPWTEFGAQFSNSNKHKIWEYSPFEKTLLLDIDYLVKSDFLNYTFDNISGVAMFDRAISLRNNLPHPREQYLFDAGIKMWWSTVVFFDRSNESKLFFDTWAHVGDNYDFYQYLYNFPGSLFRTDYCASIAVHILNGMTSGYAVDNFVDQPMYYMDQKDDIIEINNEQNWIFLAHSPKENWLNILVNSHNIDLHVMNKRALARSWDKIMKHSVNHTTVS